MIATLRILPAASGVPVIPASSPGTPPIASEGDREQDCAMPVPILRPLLPTRQMLLPYLQQIDERRYYSNYGPLVLALEERLAARFGLPAGSVTTVANATLGLVATLSSLEVP